jgi:hypothetical protein
MKVQLFGVDIDTKSLKSSSLPTIKVNQSEIITERSIGNADTQPLKNQKHIILIIRGTPLSIALIPHTTLVLGRSDQRNSLDPDIDLNPYDGVDYGVSRRHCALSYANKTLMVTDLNSHNGTFINGKKLHPNRAASVNIGDTLLLGQLEIQLLLPKTER